MFEEENATEKIAGSAADKIAQRLRAGLNVNESDFQRVVAYERVQPGDLITAEWMNKILLRLARLELLVRYSRPTGKGQGDAFSVFGRTLIEAIRIIEGAGADFQIGKVLDVMGQIVQTTAPGTGTRLVLGQFFESDDFTGTTRVNLLVTSANATGGLFKELGAEAKDMIAIVVYKAVEAQIQHILNRNKRTVNTTNDPAQERTNANSAEMQKGFSIIADRSAAAPGEGAAAAGPSSTKRRASKKAAKGSAKAGGTSGGDGK